MSVSIRTESGALRASAPVRLFEAPPVGADWSRPQFAVNADGSRFLFNARVVDRTPVGLTVVTNWPASSDRRLTPIYYRGEGVQPSFAPIKVQR
jgi:hypothetical protein